MSTTLDETYVRQSDTRTQPHHKVNLGIIGAYRGCLFGMASGAVAAGTLAAALAIAGSWYELVFDVVALFSVFVVVGGFFGALLGIVVGFFVGLFGVERVGRWAIAGVGAALPLLGAHVVQDHPGFSVVGPAQTLLAAMVFAVAGYFAGSAFERKVLAHARSAANAAPVRRMYDKDERLPFEGCALGSFVGAAAGVVVLAAFVLAILGGTVLSASDSRESGPGLFIIILPFFLFIGSIVAAIVGGAFGAIGGFLLGVARWESQAKWVGSVLATAPMWPFLGSADLGTSSTRFDLAVVAFVLGSIGLGAGLLFEHKFQLE